MGFPNNLLDTDERVVMHLHPHWKTLVMPVFWLLLIGGGLGAILATVDNSVVRSGAVAIAILLILWLVGTPVVRWISTHFVLTNRRVMTRTGILHRVGRDVPLARINDVAFNSTLFDRMVGAGNLVIESAGERGQIALHDIPHAELVQTRLYRLMEEDNERRAALHHPPSGSSTGGATSSGGFTSSPNGTQQRPNLGEPPAPPGAGPYSAAP